MHGGSSPQALQAADNRRQQLLDRLWGLAPDFLERLKAIATDTETRQVTTTDGVTVDVVVSRSADADVVRATKVILDKLLPNRVVDETGAESERDLDAEIEQILVQEASGQ